MNATATPLEPAPRSLAIGTWARWIAHPVSASESHLHETQEAQRRVIRQLWSVSLGLSGLLAAAQYVVAERTATKYLTLLVLSAVLPLLSAAASYYLLRLALYAFRVRLDVPRILTFHTAFVVTYTPLMALGAFHPRLDLLPLLARAKQDGSDWLAAFRVLGAHVMAASKAPKSAWMEGASVLGTLTVVASILLTTLYARKLRDHARVDLLRAITALALGQLVASGAVFAQLGLWYLLAYAVVQ